MINWKTHAGRILKMASHGTGLYSCCGGLAVISVGDDPASKIYVAGKRKDCIRCGFEFFDHHFDENVGLDEILTTIHECNEDSCVSGIIVQLPLPKRLQPFESLILAAITPEKDVDGFQPDSPFKPCTPEGIVYILKQNFGAIEGKTICIIGRGRLVGKPLRKMLDQESATVISCNSHTPEDNLCKFSLVSDAVVLATGQRQWFDARTVSPFTLLVDCGCFKDEDGHVYGEVYHRGGDMPENVTPVPGCVGLMTRAMLMMHVGGYRSVEDLERRWGRYVQVD